MKKKENKKMTEAESRKTEVGKPNPRVSKKLPAARNQQPRPTGSSGRAAATKRNSTVFLTIKPFIKGTYLFAKGRISESPAVRTWMMIRIYNN